MLLSIIIIIIIIMYYYYLLLLWLSLSLSLSFPFLLLLLWWCWCIISFNFLYKSNQNYPYQQVTSKTLMMHIFPFCCYYLGLGFTWQQAIPHPKQKRKKKGQTIRACKMIITSPKLIPSFFFFGGGSNRLIKILKRKRKP